MVKIWVETVSFDKIDEVPRFWKSRPLHPQILFLLSGFLHARARGSLSTSEYVLVVWSVPASCQPASDIIAVFISKANSRFLKTRDVKAASDELNVFLHGAPLRKKNIFLRLKVLSNCKFANVSIFVGQNAKQIVNKSIIFNHADLYHGNGGTKADLWMFSEVITGPQEGPHSSISSFPPFYRFSW